IVSHSGVVINVDADVSTLAGNGDTMSIMGANAKFTKYEIASVNGSTITLKVAPAWVRDGTTFAISTSEVATRLFRIMGISEDENNSIYSISATLHNPNKQAIVDEGAVFDVPSDTLNGYRVPNIENLRVINTNSETVQVSASWETATTTRKLVFELLVYTLDGAVFAQYETVQFRYNFFGIPAGTYSLGVRGRNDNGMKGAETQVSLLIGVPPMPSSVRWTPGVFSADVVPVMNITATTDTTFEFWWTGEIPASSATNIESEAQFLGRSTQWALNGLKADTTYYVYVRTRNAFGVSEFVEASGVASSDIPGMIDYIDQAIKGSETFGQLSSDLDMNAEAIIENALANDADVHRWKKQNGDFRAEIFDIRQTVITELAATATIIEGVQSQVGENSAAIERRAETVVKVDGTGSAITTLKVGAEFNGVYKSAGMAIGVEFDGANWTSQVLFSANTFGVYNPSDNSYKLAFAIENGQTFINEAFINYASITLAKIGEWKSANFVSGKTGTRMAADGSFEMNGAVAGEGKLRLVNNRITVFNESDQIVVVIGKKLEV
ncbi:DUF1983 domain-containing protein, partial [Yersinia enterocolitica]|nr:DUF1983 domain-containing protein [Yersinia enterocolitica]HDL6915200.1 DUF1983 domain-containing protein [Yersinia enterocolitica]HDL6935493.1 DUF1983 domain-containing protein [Yersinia enterocolitica]HDW8048446.1 DUF1983 domain-containing protein [Yersinia enterocolitica]